MENIFSKLLALFLVFLLLFIAPLCMSIQSQTMISTRELLNKTQTFIDEVCDTGILDDESIKQLYTDCAASGSAVDVTVTVKQRVIDPDAFKSGSTYVTYVDSDITKGVHTGDKVKVEVTAIGYSGTAFFIKSITGLYNSKIHFALEGRVR